MLPAIAPVDPLSAEFDHELARAGQAFASADVSAIYCVHGTFVGNDAFGLLTELSRFAPKLSQRCSQLGKRVIDFVARDAGNYTREFTQLLQDRLQRGAGRTIPARLFNWSSQNNHIARADGAIRLLAELAELAEQDDSGQASRVQLWSHSHGGNVLALLSQLLGADRDTQAEFFAAAKPFYRACLRQRVDMPDWQRVQELLEDADHPVHNLQLDMVTFGTPIRYGWNSDGYANLLHFIHHRPPPHGEAHQAPIPLSPWRACKAVDGDYVQQIGISGTNFIPLPIAVRTLLADWRLDAWLEADVAHENIIARLRHGTRVPDEGTTLLVDYAKIDPWLHRHIAGHGLYTKARWLPFHCQEIAQRFYGAQWEATSSDD